LIAKKLINGEKQIIHSKKRVLRRGEIKCPTSYVMCGAHIKRLLDVTSHYINEFDV
jgi:hypothetical protein